jgi:hypothetical protein
MCRCNAIRRHKVARPQPHPVTLGDGSCPRRRHLARTPERYGAAVDIDESLVFPVKLDLPACLQLGGRDWFRKSEFHVTTFTPGDLADAFDVAGTALLHAGEQCRDELTRGRSIRFDGRIARVHAEDGRQTLIAFCGVGGLEDVYRQLSAVVGRTLPVPPTHVTLYTAQPGMKGIGLSTAAQVATRTTPLAEADAAVLRSLLP